MIFTFGSSAAIVTAQTPEADADNGDVTVIDIDPTAEAPIEVVAETPEPGPVDTTPEAPLEDASTPETEIETPDSEAEVALADDDPPVQLATTGSWALSTHELWIGKYITVELRGFGANTPVSLRLVDGVGNTWPIGHESVGPTGSIDWLLRIPTNSWVVNGGWKIRASIDHQGWEYTELGEEIVSIITKPENGITFNRNPTTVNTNVTFTVSGLASNATFDLIFRRGGGSEIVLLANQSADVNGQKTGLFKVPYTPGGANTVLARVGGVTMLQATFEVRPRTKLPSYNLIRGGTTEISLAGFGKKEVVRLRWKVGQDAWASIGNIVTSNTGSYKGHHYIPSDASLGHSSVRADGTIWRQQTNAPFVGA